MRGDGTVEPFSGSRGGFRFTEAVSPAAGARACGVAQTPPPPDEVGLGAIRVTGVTKVFTVGRLLPGRQRHRIHALRDVNLLVGPRQIHAIIGTNGSGKSTLLRILATLVLATQGVATIGGIDVVREPRRARRVLGFSTGEERSLYWRLTGRQNLEFYAALCGVRSPAARITQLLDSLGLGDSGGRPVSGYSQGMARRLALARALVHEPPVLLLDEPTRSLDPLGRDAIHQVLLRLRQERGTTILMATHDLEEAAELCDTVSVLHGGAMTGPFPAGDARRLKAALSATTV